MEHLKRQFQTLQVVQMDTIDNLILPQKIRPVNIFTASFQVFYKYLIGGNRYAEL